MGVAVYAESVIPRTILAMPTSYILNVCILPTKETDGYEDFSHLGIGNEQIQSIGEFWGKFRNYALINQDQVISSTVGKEVSGRFIFQGFVVKLFNKTHGEGCNLVTAHHQGDQYGNYNVSFIFRYYRCG